MVAMWDNEILSLRVGCYTLISEIKRRQCKPLVVLCNRFGMRMGMVGCGVVVCLSMDLEHAGRGMGKGCQARRNLSAHVSYLGI